MWSVPTWADLALKLGKRLNRKKLHQHAQVRELKRKLGFRSITRPVPVMLNIEFELHPTGRVYCSPQSNGTMREVTDPAIKSLVYAAFKVMAEEAREQLGRKKRT